MDNALSMNAPQLNREYFIQADIPLNEMIKKVEEDLFMPDSAEPKTLDFNESSRKCDQNWSIKEQTFTTVYFIFS